MQRRPAQNHDVLHTTGDPQQKQVCVSRDPRLPGREDLGRVGHESPGAASERPASLRPSQRSGALSAASPAAPAFSPASGKESGGRRGRCSGTSLPRRMWLRSWSETAQAHLGHSRKWRCMPTPSPPERSAEAVPPTLFCTCSQGSASLRSLGCAS
eukprot:scaffold3854_cov251-Pinguiococcus_pyrenoidosus.AAC.9